MRDCLKLAVCLIILSALPAIAQEAPNADTRDISSGRPPRTVNCQVEDRRVHFEAPYWDWVGSTVSAPEGFNLTVGRKRFIARKGFFNTNTLSGQFEKVIFTSCLSKTPDYRLVADEIRLVANRRLVAKNPSLYLGNTKVLALPSMRLRIGSRSQSNFVFPRPGFDKQDGFTLSQDFLLMDADNYNLHADLQLGTKTALQGQVYGVIGLDGQLLDRPGRYFTFQSLRSDALRIPTAFNAPCPCPEPTSEKTAYLRGFGTFTIRQRTYNVNQPNLMVYRNPELGLSYTGNQIYLTKDRLDPRLETYPELVTSGGIYREVPGNQQYLGRGLASVLAAVHFIPLGSCTSLQPVLSYSWSVYGNGDNYRVTTLGADASHLWPSGSMVSLRYLDRRPSGMTPFQFDRVEIKREYQLGAQAQYRKFFLGYVLGYNAETHRAYDWEVMYGWRSDCLGTWVRYDQRLARFSLDVAILNP